MTQSTQELQYILGSLFNLTRAQSKLLIKLLSYGEQNFCINQLKFNSESGRSTLQKYLKVLLHKGLVSREAKTLKEFREICVEVDLDDNCESNKGYLYIYRVISLENLMKKAEEVWKEWKVKLSREINSQ
ncbi:MAG: hypothetical protein ACTSR8_15920 [Promethearchaeota archaeon]